MTNSNRIKVACFGEVLWDLFPGKDKSAGGAPMNVAYHLKKHNMEPLVITRIGNDQSGSDIITILNGWGLDTTNCQIDMFNPTGIAHVVCDCDEVSYDFPYPSAWDFIEYSPEHLAAVNGGIFIFGSLASRSPVSENTLLSFLKIAAYKVFDVNLRKPFYSVEKIEILLYHTDLLKVNENEIKIIALWFFPLIDTIDGIIASLCNIFSISEIIITKGKKGATYYNSSGLIVHQDTLSVTVADTIGSGDSFLASFLAHRIAGSTVETAMHKASVLGAFVTSQHGACPDYSLADLEHMLRYSPVQY